MGRAVEVDEFPLLGAFGLYAADIRGDGNCLFNALSDQLYGNQSKHKDIRTRVIEYMREHASYYKQFINVHPGGGVRRNPKRKNVGAYSTPVSAFQPTPEDIERVFESHMKEMSRGGTWGDNMEITAFSAAFGVDVRIYQRDFAYMVSASNDGVKREVVHIAYHIWEHYSSIRNVDGPHTGLPHVKITHLSRQAEITNNEKLSKTPYVQPWMIEVVTQSLPYLADRATIERTLEECRGSIDNAVSKLLDAEERGSVSSAQTSSSIERDADSDDEDVYGPNKKQDRRLSRATKAVLKERKERRVRELALRQQASKTSMHNDDKKPPTNEEGHDAAKQDDSDETEEENWRDATFKDESTSASDTNTSSTSSSRPKLRAASIKLKLSQPKPTAAAAATTINSANPTTTTTTICCPKTQQKQEGSKPKRVTTRDRKGAKKAAQKAAAKERKQAAAVAGNGTAAKKAGALVSNLTKNGKENAPVLEAGIKILYI